MQYLLFKGYDKKRLFVKKKGADMNLNTIIEWTSTILVIVGALNWGLVGALNFNLVTSLFGETTTITKLVYICVGLAGIIKIILIAR